jgi:hypothetical protein
MTPLLLLIGIGIGIAVLAAITRWRRHRQFGHAIEINDKRRAELIELSRNQSHGR